MSPIWSVVAPAVFQVGIQTALWFAIVRSDDRRRAWSEKQKAELRELSGDSVRQLLALEQELHRVTRHTDTALLALVDGHNRLVKGVQEIRDLLLDEGVPPEVRQRAAHILNQIAGSL